MKLLVRTRVVFLLAATALLLPTIRRVHAEDVPKLEPVQVTGHYDNGIGTTDAASAGVITPQLIDDRPMLRPGEVLEYIRESVVTRNFRIALGTICALRISLATVLRQHGIP